MEVNGIPGTVTIQNSVDTAPPIHRSNIIDAIRFGPVIIYENYQSTLADKFSTFVHGSIKQQIMSKPHSSLSYHTNKP